MAQLPSDMNAFNRQIIEEFRATKGQLSGRMAGRQVLLITTKGARTGEPRTAVIGYRKSGAVFVVIASANGAAAHPSWYVNLLADPHATIEVGPEKVEVRARTVKGKEREKLAKVIEYLEPQQKLTARTIPVVALEPVKKSAKRH
ncbi:MAG TPA: nitroreductase/quinone reductase family protein [Candidatus Dormibacteraeota bacterium]|nr:nitroreductase/quinone reductase family protein [Candidatus Dormibacteraeota bacterium]